MVRKTGLLLSTPAIQLLLSAMVLEASIIGVFWRLQVACAQLKLTQQYQVERMYEIKTTVGEIWTRGSITAQKNVDRLDGLDKRVDGLDCRVGVLEKSPRERIGTP